MRAANHSRPGSVGATAAIDYPSERTAGAVAALERADLSDAVKERIAFGNARALLRL